MSSARSHRYVVGSFFAKHAERERGDGLHLGQLVAAPAADDARIDRDIRPAVRRRVGRCGDPREVRHLLDDLARAVLAHDHVVHSRARRQRSESRFEIFRDQSREIGECDPVLEGAEFSPRLALEAPVAGGRADHHVDTFEIGLQRQRELD
jgi:hypothetical protein